MRQAMTKWLSRHRITFSADTANSICSSLGLDGEKVDECLGLCYQLEKGDINEADFTGGLSLLTGKKPEEVMEVLRDMKGSGEQQKTVKKFAFYDKPTSKAKLIKLWDGSTPEMRALDVGAEWVGEFVEILEERTEPDRWVAKSEKGSLFLDKPSAFTVTEIRSEPKKD